MEGFPVIDPVDGDGEVALFIALEPDGAGLAVIKDDDLVGPVGPADVVNHKGYVVLLPGQFHVRILDAVAGIIFKVCPIDRLHGIIFGFGLLILGPGGMLALGQVDVGPVGSRHLLQCFIQGPAFIGGDPLSAFFL